MRPVRREELLDLSTYERSRAELRPGVLEAKRRRRVHVGALTFLFENAATVRYQVQEMIRAERMTREEDIRHELETYNELLGGKGELGVSLLIEIPDPAERDRRLREWLELPRHLYLRLADGRKIRPRFDPRQVGEDRLSSVQYLRFDVGGEAPVAAGADLPGLTVETALEAEQREALRADLAADS
ncbi:DUF3501 family protein [Anaeromyxobacter terrae]|uniref:DUF3501 family protein n=1 Tax=Anaeromyxobacter terrae TaxID=2925406 RepID=UPI001F56FDED|nr:DUF3501 family protein [Anaeromyxobacter sp. SG22]